MSNIRKSFGTKSFAIGSGAAATSLLNSYLITGVNQILLPSSFNGIKWVSATPTTTTQDWSSLSIVLLSAVTPAGIGTAMNVATNELVLIGNIGGVVPWRTDLLNGTLVSLSGTTFTVTGPTVGDVTPSYTVNIPYMRY